MQLNTQTQESKVYKTADLYYAAYLSVAGCTVEHMSKSGRQIKMHFRDDGQIDDLRKQYYNRTAKIPALQYAEEIKNLKNQIAEILAAE